ncbi:glycosyltransferase [uncultured Microbacterium sp.]|uniref:glycosyltransferase n=1 Tax=uncultured Microbacterium sp. TaxID=191216 RepID=UPI0025F21CC2|nr:glycosyltransferase [uncultured Microbacterium sp.]
MNAAIPLMLEQRRSGYEVMVLAKPGEEAARLRAAGVEVELLPDAARVSLVARRVRELSRQAEVDVVHAHTVGVLVPALVFRFRRPALVATAHSLFRMREFLVLAADVVVAVSENNRERLARFRFGRKKVTTIANCVVGAGTCVAYESKSRRDANLLFVGGLYERKGADVAIRALRILRERGEDPLDLDLDLLGHGPERERLVALASSLGLANNVHFHGFVADPGGYYDHASALIHPPRDEPFGLVVAEAQMHGVPVIATRVGGLPELLGNGRYGSLVPPDDPDALARQIGRVLASDAAASEAAARSAAGAKRWSPEAAFLAHDRLYRSVLKRNCRRNSSMKRRRG